MLCNQKKKKKMIIIPVCLSLSHCEWMIASWLHLWYHHHHHCWSLIKMDIQDNYITMMMMAKKPKKQIFWWFFFKEKYLVFGYSNTQTYFWHVLFSFGWLNQSRETDRRKQDRNFDSNQPKKSQIFVSKMINHHLPGFRLLSLAVVVVVGWKYWKSKTKFVKKKTKNKNSSKNCFFECW